MKADVCSALAVCSHSQILGAANNTSVEHEPGEPPTSMCMGSCFSWLWLDNTACSESHVLHCSSEFWPDSILHVKRSILFLCGAEAQSSHMNMHS